MPSLQPRGYVNPDHAACALDSHAISNIHTQDALKGNPYFDRSPLIIYFVRYFIAVRKGFRQKKANECVHRGVAAIFTHEIS